MAKISVGVIGLGTVGTGVIKLLQNDPRFRVKWVAVRDKVKPREVDLSAIRVTDQPFDLVNDPELEIIIEVAGGTNPAYEVIRNAIAQGKHIVTANKEVIAKHGSEIFDLAHRHNVTVLFEAAVGGGIPLISTIQRGLQANEIQSVAGILNGTTNFILTAMQERGQNFADALAEAQALGYAEADPTDDVTGKDAAAKMAILARLAFDTPVHLDQVRYEGIEHVQPADLEYARELGLELKLIGTAERIGDGLSVRVHPIFLYPGHPLASVSGPFNAVTVESEAITEITMSGPGAGGPQTASAVLGDVISAMIPPASTPPTSQELRIVEDVVSSFYLHLEVADEPGVLAQVAHVLAGDAVSVKSVVQKGLGEQARLVMVLHPVLESRFGAAVKEIARLEFLRAPPRAIRVLEEEFS